ncbi:hypothetical protein BC937DRAFT_93778, partial [Endogone sp. FLAS-F59071]
MTTLEDKSIWENPDQDPIDDLGQEILRLSTDEIFNRTRLLDNDIKVRVLLAQLIFQTILAHQSQALDAFFVIRKRAFYMVMKSEHMRLQHEQTSMKEKIKDNKEKIKMNKQLPYLVGNIVELLDVDPNDEQEEEGANVDLDATRKGKCAVIKTSTRQTIFLPLIGLVDPATLKPGDLIGVNKDSYLVLDTLPA